MTSIKEVYDLTQIANFGREPPPGWELIEQWHDDTGFDARAYKAPDGRIFMVMQAADPATPQDRQAIEDALRGNETRQYSSAEAAVRALRALLKSRGEDGPIQVVGHSFGGFLTQLVVSRLGDTLNLTGLTFGALGVSKILERDGAIRNTDRITNIVIPSDPATLPGYLGGFGISNGDLVGRTVRVPPSGFSIPPALDMVPIPFPPFTPLLLPLPLARGSNLFFQHMYDGYGRAIELGGIGNQQIDNITLPPRDPLDLLLPVRKGELDIWQKPAMATQIAEHWSTVGQGGDDPETPATVALRDASGVLTGERLVFTSAIIDGLNTSVVRHTDVTDHVLSESVRGGRSGQDWAYRITYYGLNDEADATELVYLGSKPNKSVANRIGC